MRRKLEFYREKKTSLLIDNCQVTKSKVSEELEIKVDKYASFSELKAMFELPETPVKKDNLKKLLNFQRVTAVVKVKAVEEKCQVPDGRWKQDIKISDECGSGRLTVWQDEIGKMDVGKSYRLSDVMVREFRGQKFLSTLKEKSEIEEIDDIGEIASDDDSDGDEGEARVMSTHVRDVRVAVGAV